MSYHSLLPFVAEYCKLFAKPALLEIGVDYGKTPLSLLSWIPEANFNYFGIDIHIPDSLLNTLDYHNIGNNRIVFNVANSLNILPALVDLNKETNALVFTCILVDGDHNYYTVKKELDYLLNFADKYTIFLCDDYYGKWSEKDLYYSERGHHKDIAATERRHTLKRGVKAAVDEFLEENSNYKLSKYQFRENGTLTDSECVGLFRKDNDVDVRKIFLVAAAVTQRGHRVLDPSDEQNIGIKIIQFGRKEEEV